MQIQLLGPVRVLRGGVHIDIPTAGRRAVLGLLGLASGRAVSRAELIDALWHEDPPHTAVNVIQTHVKHLRKLLEPDRPKRAPSSLLPSVGDGYGLRTAGCDIDVVSFRTGVNRAAAARRAGDHTQALTLFDTALGLWRAAAPLSDVPALAAHPSALALVEERFAALAAKGETLLAAGAADEAVALFEQVAHARPLDESALARLIRGYEAAGRRAAAVSTYHEVRRRLADELGIGPGPDLVSAYHALLAEEGAGPRTPRARRWRVPATLPGDVADFVGREQELARLGRVLLGAPGTAVPIAVVSGTAGVGKTALALHWSHLARTRFPDGQLHVDLRGYDPQQPLSGGDALARLLSALGLPAHEVPLETADRVTRYRTEVSGRRILIVLDNASSVDQVRPLLPGTGSCAVVVTSRDTLGELVARHGARRLDLDLLPLGDSLDLLRRLIGERIDTEPGVAEALAAQCVGLPLALRVAAELAATLRTTPLPYLVSELADRRRRLDMLDSVGSPVSAVFSWSYQHLPAAAARTFRLLGLQFGPHISPAASAALTGRSPEDARAALTLLTRAHLVHPAGPDRYGMHDLLRAYATELAHADVTPADQAGARRRLVDYYLHTAHTAGAMLDHRDPIELPPAAPGVPAAAFADRDSALRWFASEHQTLLAAVDSAPDTHVGYLARTVSAYLEQRGHWPDWVTTQLAALAAAQRLGDRPGIAAAHLELGRAHARMGRYAEADRLLGRAVSLFEELGDPLGQAHGHNNLTLVFERQLDLPRALEHATLALAKYRAAGNRVGEARALNNMGWCHTRLGRYAEAVAHCERALARQREIGDRSGESATLDTLGFVHHNVGRHRQAIGCYERARDLYRECGDRFNEASLLTHLGDTARAAGEPGTAGEAWRNARDILTELGHTATADEVAAKLAALGAAAVRPADGSAPRPRRPA
ncbi:BTAD domain-containing putative transcriptional regulator [Streptomyces sp. NPDC058674]|uniref:AfsR/SARP family transcriptional regulator n=1 Tax=Streptomyces sp. NPDC058674 TaxID=3346592 RepID=UPI00366521EB